MKTFYLLIGIVLNCSLTIGQNAIPNPGFEDWSVYGGLFNSYEDPDGWGTSNSVTTTFQFQTATKATSPQFVRSGDYALRLETHYIGILDLVAPGGVATSELEIDIATQSVVPTTGVPFNLRPTSLEGWYQYYPAADDSARVAMLLRRWNDDTQERDTIAIALFETIELADEYTQFIAPFEYQSDLDPDTMLLGILCGKVEDAPEGTVMYVDELGLNYDVTHVPVAEIAEIGIYPNPSSGGLWFENNGYMELCVINAQDAFVRTLSLAAGITQVDLGDLAPGIYLLNFSDHTGAPAGYARAVVTH